LNNSKVEDRFIGYAKSKPMKHESSYRNSTVFPPKKDSVKILMEKMGMSKKEVLEVSEKYGVSPSKLIDIMEMSKYRFVYSDKKVG
jgi:hypothetical protein